MNGNRFDDLCQEDKLYCMAEEYILSCRDSSGAAKLKDRLPNLAGFCRHFGIRSTELARLKSEFPELHDTLCLIFEDEALNFSISPTLMAAYFKKRLGYGEKENEHAGGFESGEMRLIFEHDINNDGL